ASDTFEVLEPGYFAVSGVDAPDVVEGETLEVTATIENTGGDAATQTVEMSSGVGSDSKSISLNGGESTTETFTTGTSSGDAGSYTATVSSDNDSASDTFEVLEPGYFAVSGVDAPDVVEGDTLQVTADIENTGDEADTQTVEMSSGVGSDSKSISLNGGESTTETFTTGTSSGDAGSYTATVSSDNDSASDTFEVLEPGYFAVSGVDAPDVVEGETLEVTAAIENTGGEAATQTVEMSSDLGNDNVSVTLNPGDSTSETFMIETSSGDVGSYTAEVSSQDDSSSDPFEVLEASYFAVSDVNAPDVVEGETLEVTATIENTGSVEDTQEVHLTCEVGDDFELVQLGSRETKEVTLSVETSSGDAGSYTAEVASEDDSGEDTFSVSAPSDFTVDIIEPSEGDEFVVEGDITVEYTVENLGEAEATQVIEFTVDGASEDTEEVTLASGETYESEFTWTAENTGEYELEVRSEDSTDAVTVSVVEGDVEYELTIETEDGGTTDPEPGAHTYYEGTEAKVEALPDEGWVFSHWEGDVPQDQEQNVEITIAMDEDKTVTAHFTEQSDVEHHELTITVEGEGTIVVNGVDAETPYNESYQNGTTVELTDSAAENWTFSHWDGDYPEGQSTSETMEIVMDGERTITAYFQELGEREYELSIIVDGEGSTEPDPGKHSYREGEMVLLRALPTDGWVFSHWEGDVPEGEENKVEVTLNIDRDRTVTAHFVKEAYFEIGIIDFDGKVEVGEEAVIEYRLENTGDVEGTEEVNITIYDENGDVVFEDSEEFTLGPDEEQESQVTWESDEPGEYALTVGEEAEETIVVEDSSRTSSFLGGWCGLWWVILIVILLIGVLLAILVWKRRRDEERFPTLTMSSSTLSAQDEGRKRSGDIERSGFSETYTEKKDTSRFVGSESHQKEPSQKEFNEDVVEEPAREVEEVEYKGDEKGEDSVFLEEEEKEYEKVEEIEGKTEAEPVETEESGVAAAAASPGLSEDSEIECDVCGRGVPEDKKECPYCGVGLEKEVSLTSSPDVEEQPEEPASDSIDDAQEMEPEEETGEEGSSSSMDDDIFYECDECGFLITEEVEKCPYCDTPIKVDKKEE
ncbi:MAG: CARDB domain-containing protein, partial [Candidatus Natronoplasma sp.]